MKYPFMPRRNIFAGTWFMAEDRVTNVIKMMTGISNTVLFMLILPIEKSTSSDMNKVITRISSIRFR
jgi:hypothetical protein